MRTRVNGASAGLPGINKQPKPPKTTRPPAFFRKNRQKRNNRQSYYNYLPILKLGEDAALPLWDRCSDVWGASTL